MFELLAIFQRTQKDEQSSIHLPNKINESHDRKSQKVDKNLMSAKSVFYFYTLFHDSVGIVMICKILKIIAK